MSAALAAIAQLRNASAASGVRKRAMAVRRLPRSMYRYVLLRPGAPEMVRLPGCSVVSEDDVVSDLDLCIASLLDHVADDRVTSRVRDATERAAVPLHSSRDLPGSVAAG